MPEYSTPTLTPAGTSKLTGMNGSSAGNFLVSDILDIIRNTFGQANGVATLDSSGKLPTAQLPDIADDVLVYASKALLPAQGVEAKIYITTDDNVLYRWDVTLGDYVQLSVDLSDYATLDDLAAEESARETADTNLNDAIAQHEARIENLEEAHGSYHEVDVKSVYTIPSGKAKNWIVDGLRGVSRVENNLVQNGNFASTSGWVIGDPATISASGNVCTISTNGLSDPTLQGNALGTIQGHFYLVFAKVRYNSVLPSSQPWFGSGGYDGITINTSDFTVGKWTNCVGVFARTNSSGNDKIRFYTRATSTAQTIDVADFFLVDLNVYFKTTDLSFLGATDSAKLATIQQKYPELLEPSDYGTSALFPTYSAVKSVGKNLVSGYNPTQGIWNTGGFSPMSGYVSTTLIKVVQGKTYIASIFNKTTKQRVRGLVYSLFAAADSTGASDILTNDYVTIPSGINYISLRNYTDDVSLINTDNYAYQLEEGSSATDYSPYMTDTLTFPSPVSLKSAGAVAEEYYPCVEVNGEYKSKKTNPLGFHTFDGTESWGLSSGYFQWNGLNNVIKRPSSGTEVPNLLIIGFLPCNWNKTEEKAIYVVPSTQTQSNHIWIKDSSFADVASLKAYLNGKTLIYELATPNPDTYADPILNNLISTEPGGTIESILTNPVDDSMTLGYINL